ncbi:MAG: hypothetical protein L0387_06915, partial [Acidobacteria bacterium]|nr:hypothetical protein [Acidobacteriota bacterium]
MIFIGATCFVASYHQFKKVEAERNNLFQQNQNLVTDGKTKPLQIDVTTRNVDEEGRRDLAALKRRIEKTAQLSI